MAEEIKVEIVEKEIVGDKVLDLARKTMHKSIVRRQRIRRIERIGIPIIAAILIILIPVMIHLGNSQTNDIYYWKSLISSAEVNYDELTKGSSISLKEINEQNQGHLYYIENVERTETFILKQDDETIMFEEHYIYNGVECTIFVMNLKSNITNTSIFLESFEDVYLLPKNIYLNYGILENEYYAKFISDYMYQIKINSTDIDSIETILSNLTND
ncbi:MAG: hypothetical protein K2J85_07930 [Anaeroplasmataceae bacterium]|nr:hypothetical protein [Anaeroplasmataceae bacterium]